MKTIFKFLMTVSLLIFISQFNVFAEESEQFQTIRGKVIDADTQQPLIGAGVDVVNSNPYIGVITNIDGTFTIENVPLGRVTIQVSYMGYEPKVIPNVEVGSAKQVILNVALVESLIKLDEVVITKKVKKDEALNQMSLVSAKVCTVEETSRYAGALNDPARMVSSFAGVTGDAEGNNDIVVRGNSPKGILWRLEGIDIPNPNHFANEGGSGGPINALNSAMLDNSDFFSGAFAPEYGNAFSGVFDMKLRSGNNQKHENIFSFGVLGTDLTMEGPFSNNYSGSYLVNYRYSSLDILDKAGIVDFGGVPKYQDGSFKINLPTKKFGNFSAFGLFGISHIIETGENELGEIEWQGDFGASLHVYGLTNTYLIGESAYLKNTISYQSTTSGGDYSIPDSNKNLFHAYDENFKHSYIKYATVFNKKIDAKHNIKLGATYTALGYDVTNKYDFDNTGIFKVILDSQGNSGQIQSYINWKYRISQDLTLISGVHYLNFLLNNDQSVEPRLGLKYQISTKHNVTLGAGLHSKTESLSTYFIQLQDENNNYYKPNEDLEMGRAAHIVAGYGNKLTKNHYLKIEAYYQHLYNLGVENDSSSYMALNSISTGWEERDFVNKGTGRNYGLEMTLERYYNNNFYYLATASLYESKITALDGIERDSRYNANFAANFLIGKEFVIKPETKKNTFAVNFKLAYLGGNYYTPLNLEESRKEGESRYSESDLFAKKADNVVQANFSCSYKINRKKTRHEIKLDIQNVINYQARIDEYYDNIKDELAYNYQLPILPNIVYSIQF